MHRSRSHDAVIRVFDVAGNVIETHEQKGEFKEPGVFAMSRHDDIELIRSHRVVAWDDITLERSKQMPKYLFQGSYTEQGLKGVLQEGGSKRREAAEQLAKGMGGRLEAYYYAFGNNDFVIITDLPSKVDAAALSLAVNASGAVESRATVLITPEEVDQATKKTVNYHPPGK